MNRIALLVFLFCISAITRAEQLSYQKAEEEDGYQFQFAWLDHNKQKQSLNFAISNQAIFSRFRSFNLYKPKAANRFVGKYVYKNWQKDPIEGVNITVKRTQGNFNVEMSTRDESQFADAQNKIRKLQREGYNEYLDKNYYQPFRTFEGINAVKPDHVRFAIESIPDLKHVKPMILEKIEIQNVRNATNYVLAFIQSIPYSELESRTTSSGAGFNPPAKLLWENQGDCDSKVTLASSLLRSLMPRVKIAMFFIDGHALMGVAVDDKNVSQDETISIDGITYSLAEPTGPAALPLGSVAPESLQAIRAGHYTVEYMSEG